MATAGPNAGGTFADETSVGTLSWSTPSNASAEDATATSVAFASGGISYYLKCTNFGFSIPSGSTILGISARVVRKAQTSGSSVQDYSVRLVKGGTIQGDDKASASYWPNGGYGAQIYGASNVLWGLAWTDTDINASDFGIVVSAQVASGLENGLIDFVSITVTYTPPGSVAVTGTCVETVSNKLRESHIVAGGKTIILTVSSDTWVAAGATFDAQRQNIIDGIDSAQAEANGWDATVKATQGVAGVVRTSSTVVTITLDAQASYAITANETITATIPATALTGGNAIVASPTFRVLDDVPRSANLLGGLGIGKESPPRNMGEVRSGIVPLHWKDTRPR